MTQAKQPQSLSAATALRPFLTLKEAAPLVGMSMWFIYDRIGKKNGPPFVKRGNRIKFPRDKFMEWAEQPIIK